MRWRKLKSNVWWTAVFCALTCVAHFHFIKEKKAAVQSMSARFAEMEKTKWAALQNREELALALASQDDPAWIEMVLMRDLGVVPEGFLKVHFKK